MINCDLHIGAIFIAYNAEQTLENFYKNFPKSEVKTMILVDDASTDGTYGLALKLGIPTYRNAHNLGYGGNLKRALALAEKHGMDIIIDLHPDGEYDASAIPAAIEKIRNGADLVIGNRFTKITDQINSGMYLWKLIPILLLNTIARYTLNLKLNDIHQGFRVYTRHMLKSINYKENSNNYLFSFELIVQAVMANLDIAEVPVKTHYVGNKRGATLKQSTLYSLGVIRIIALFILSKLGAKSRLFR